MENINNPHDKLFKETFSDINVTKSFLNHYLLEEILGIIDIETLTPLKDSFITDDLVESYSDLLFQVKINGRPGYVTFLFEHKSYQTNHISIQLLKYMTEVWDAKLTKEKEQDISIIIPIVIYHGINNWKKEKRISSLIAGFKDLPKSVQNYVPDFDFFLFDLSTVKDDLKGSIKLRVFLDVFAHIFTKSDSEFEVIIGEHVQTLLEIKNEQPDIVAYFKTYIMYVLSARESITLNKLHHIVENISTEGGMIVATAADKLRREGLLRGRVEGEKKGRREGIAEGEKKGRREGIAEGIAEGEKKGKMEEKIEVARKLLLKDSDIKTIMEITNLSKEEIQKIKGNLE